MSSTVNALKSKKLPVKDKSLRLLQPAEAAYQSLFENAVEGIFQSTPAGRFLNVNPAMAHIFGYDSPQEMIETVTDISTQIHADSKSRLEFTRRLKKEGKVEKFEARNLRKDGSMIWTSTNARIVRDAKGKALYYEGFIQDISERKRAEEALRFTRYSLDTADDTMAVIDRDARFVDVNAAFCRSAGYSREELLSMKVHDIDPDYSAEIWSGFWEKLKRSGSLTFESRHRNREGKVHPVEVIATFFEYSGKEYHCGFTRDITERKRAGQELRDSEAHYRGLADSITDVFFEMDENLRYTYWNKASELLTGIPAKEAIGKSLYDIFPDTPQTRRAKEVYLDVLKKQQPQTFVNSYKLGERDYFFEISVYPSANGISVISNDITERKRAEEALQRSEEKYRDLVENLNEVIYSLDQEGTIIYVSPVVRAVLGYTPADLIGTNFMDVVHPEDTQQVRMAFEDLRDEQFYPSEYRIVSKNGEIRWVRTSSRPIFDGKQVIGLHGVLTDITERKQAEQAIMTSEAKYRSLVDNASAGIANVDIRGNFNFVNQTLCTMLGYIEEEMVGRPFAAFLHPEDTNQILEMFQRGFQHPEETPHLEYRILHKNGQIIHCFSAPTVIREKDEIVGFSAIIMDITERKCAEEEREIILHDVGERVKELRALHRAAQLFQDRQITTSEVLQEIAAILTGAWQYPEISTARVTYAGAEFTTPNYSDTPWKQSATFATQDGKKGAIEVAYLEERPAEVEGPFLAEERNLINTLANDLSAYLERKRVQEEVQQRNEDLAMINAINDAVNRGESLQAIIKLISEKTVRVFNSQGVTLHLLNETRDRFVMQNMALPPQIMTKVEKIIGKITPTIELDPHEAYPFRQVLESKQAYLLTEPAQIQESMVAYIQATQFSEKTRARLRKLLPGLPKVLGIRSMMVVPLISEGEVIGTLDMGSHSIFTKEDLRSLETIAGQLTVAINRKRVEEALKRSEERYRDLVENLNDVIYSLDPECTITYVSPVVQAVLGYSLSDLVGTNLMDIVHPADRQEISSAFGDVLSGQQYPSDYRVFAKNGEIRWVRTSSRPIFDGKQVIGLHGVLTDITERKQAEQALSEREEQLRSLTMYLQSAREEERTFVAREIHDEFGQNLTALKIDLGWLAHHLPAENAILQEKVKSMVGIVDSSIKLVQRIATSLRPGLLDDLGLAAAIEWQTQGFSKRTNITHKLDLEQGQAALERDLSTTIFRIFQEALTNITRHSAAKQFQVTLYTGTDEIRLTVQDDGCGITPEQVADSRSFGLMGMRERALALGGELKIEGQPGQGTTVSLRIPRQAGDQK